MALSTEESLLLSNLMYIDPKMKENQTVEEWINSLPVNDWKGKNGPGDNLTSNQEWIDIINEAKKHPELMNMEVANVNVDYADGGGGGYSTILVDRESKEAVVAFCGTAGEEWKDDFTGGGLADGSDGISTKQQENALEWYQKQYKEQQLEGYDITITGHSKGGNKAKYITIMDDTIDNCVSFDGQGFSDEFFDEYSGKIAASQGKIHNHNCDHDYVNILLNDVGDSTFYEGGNYGESGLVEAHCPNNLFKKDADGNLIMVVNPNGQSPELQKLDHFFNNFLRSMDGEDKRKMLDILGSLVQSGVSSKGNIADILNELASDPQNSKYMGYLLAYMIRYQQQDPELMAAVRKALSDFGMEDIIKTADAITYLMEHDFLRRMVEALAAATVITAGMLSPILAALAKLGLRLSDAELMRILSILGYTEAFVEIIEINDDPGDDKKIGSAAGGRPADFSVKTGTLKDAGDAFRGYAQKIEGIKSEVEQIRKKLFIYNILSLGQIKGLENRLNNNMRGCSKLEESVMGIYNLYENYEKGIISKAEK